MAFLIEQAGGAASDGRKRILDLKAEEIHQRSPVFIGCKEDVALAEEFIRKHDDAKAKTGAGKAGAKVAQPA